MSSQTCIPKGGKALHLGAENRIDLTEDDDGTDADSGLTTFTDVALDKTLKTLEPDSWLSDLACQTVFDILACGRVKFVGSQFLDLSKPVSNLSPIPIRHETHLIILLNHNNKHWTSAYFDLTTRQIEHYNSMESAEASLARSKLLSFATEKVELLHGGCTAWPFTTPVGS